MTNLRAAAALVLAGLLAAPSAEAGKAKPRKGKPPAAGTAPAAGAGDEEAVTITSTPPPATTATPPTKPDAPPPPPTPAAAPAPAAAAGASAAPRGEPPALPPPTVKASDLAALRAEYDALRDALFRSKARAQAVEDATSTTKLSAQLRWKAPKGYVARRAQIRLDDAALWDSGDKALGGDPVTIVERGVAPGRHSLSVRLEVRGTKDDKLGYASEQTFVLDLPEGKSTEVAIVADEDGDLPEYEPIIRIEPRTKK